MEIIRRERSVIIACDVDLELFERIVEETGDIPGVGGYKLGFYLGLRYGLEKVVEVAREYTEKPLIYDHQKAATDIPALGEKFAKLCAQCGINAVILFPQAGPETERKWVKEALNEGLGVVVGGLMTHRGYTDTEGGWIRADRIEKIYEIAADLGVNNFVVPGNRPEEARRIRGWVEGKVKPIFYVPGLIAQGGKVEKVREVLGRRWHAIVGRGIYRSEDMRNAALEIVKELK